MWLAVTGLLVDIEMRITVTGLLADTEMGNLDECPLRKVVTDMFMTLS